MFVAIYRWRLRPGMEDQFAEGWHAATQIALDRFGSGGSALLKAADGTHYAVARWASREDRQAFFERAGIDPAARERQQAAVLETFPAVELDMVDDLWALLSRP